MLPTPKTNKEKILLALYNKLNKLPYDLPTAITNEEKILSAIVKSEFDFGVGGSSPGGLDLLLGEFSNVSRFADTHDRIPNQSTLYSFLIEQYNSGYRLFAIFETNSKEVIQYFSFNGTYFKWENNILTFDGECVSLGTGSPVTRTSPLDWSGNPSNDIIETLDLT